MPMRANVRSMRRMMRAKGAVIPELEKVKALAVYLHGRRIGIINRLAGDRYIFAFEQDYVEDPERPTLSLAYKGQAGRFVAAGRTVGRGLPPLCSDPLAQGDPRPALSV